MHHDPPPLLVLVQRLRVVVGQESRWCYRRLRSRLLGGRDRTRTRMEGMTMFHDPYDGEVPAQPLRQDAGGSFIPLGTQEEFTGRTLRAAVIVAACVLALAAWLWLA